MSNCDVSALRGGNDHDYSLFFFIHKKEKEWQLRISPITILRKYQMHRT